MKKKSPIYFSIGNDKVKIIDGHIYFENENGETTVYVNIPSVISAIQSKFLGEK
ncbi:hypothetical protein [Staphylococcus pseudintermedius]|uniref:hypothetical protein n=1 Tax=Staphylococcus pseudintermedius TaxID=283734 RepID=UPI001EE4E921|nr:hypothetical protein [Staphylococcus pseudintermedius]